ncbi:MAG: phosphomevalonate kinase [Pycnora praestabilis]|nr:MAG: phosphomevalonate kinase [Pycnora praestabilis]
MSAPSTSVSAPGKVLLAGGYLVLDREYTGLVFGLDARIHVHVQDLPTSPGVTFSEITVRSPQFREAEWRYGYRLTEDEGGIEVTQLRGLSSASLSRNPFVETALAFALTYIATVIPPNIKPTSLTIFADNDYYSQPSSPTPSSRSSHNSRFIDFNVPLLEAHKTGLGSSAALVTAFTAALLTHYLSRDVFALSVEPEKPRLSTDSAKTSLSTDSGKSRPKDGGRPRSPIDIGKGRLHNLAQAAHCAAQGKIGSGFDVAAAVYGSCVYRRFSPKILEGLGEVGSAGFARRLKLLVEDTDSSRRWDTHIIKSAISVPKGLRLVMCDVDCGSQSVGMAKQVLKWRKEKPEQATALWNQLQGRNEELGTMLTKLARSQHPNQNYESLRYTISAIRSLLREMSAATGVPVEPPAQTRLLTTCSAVTGVIGGVVPGAGGYDAIALLVEDREDVLRRLHDVLKNLSVEADEGSGEPVGKVRVLGVREEMDGVRVETTEQYGSWL